MKQRQVLDILKRRHDLLRSIRTFFYDRGYIEVETANLIKTAPPDPNIDPLEVFMSDKGPYYLHTSPEMGMKRLLTAGHKGIFQICKVYRVEEYKDIHSTEFTMLEWYREDTYLEAMAETNELVSYVARDFPGEKNKDYQKPFTVYDLETLFLNKTGIDPFHLERDALFDQMKTKGFSGIDNQDDLSSLFFKLFIQEIEGAMEKDTPYFIKDWPKFISTMAKENDGDPVKVERFAALYEGP